MGHGAAALSFYLMESREGVSDTSKNQPSNMDNYRRGEVENSQCKDNKKIETHIVLLRSN